MVYRLEAAYVLALVFPVFTVGLPWLHQADENGLLYDSAEVKILEEIYEPGPSNTRHVGDRVKRSADVMPSSLHFQIRYGSREQNIRMRRNAFGQNKEEKSDVPDFPVFIIENGRIKRKELQHDKGIALYSNETTGSSFLVRKRSNRADFVLNGVFYDGLDQLYLTRDADGGLHQIHKQNGVVDFRNDYISSVRGQATDAKVKIRERTNVLLQKPGVRSKRQLMQAGENEVQLFMIADNKDYRTWLKYYRHNATLTQIEMNLYYAFIANSMNVRYSSIKNVDSSFSLKILISGLLIVNSQKISTWTEDSFDPVTHCVDASRALESFRLWVKSSRYDLPPSDHWMLFTGFDISTDGNRNVAGLAKLGGMCSLNSVSLIEQDNTGSVGATAAHELGHSLSALHDGEEQDCVDEDNYIMSRKLKTPDEELLASRPWQFSPCSVRSFKKFISESKCTQKSVRGMSVLSTSLSPGQVFSADLQCQLALGNGSYFGRSLQLREGYPSLCRRMWCAVPDDPGFYQGIFALENTSCGDGKWCQRGQCVPDVLAPRMEDICPQGDDPTAPCALDDCPYYTNRTKLVYCCHTCRQMPTWQEDRSLVVQVVRQIEVSQVTQTPQRSPDIVDILRKSTISPEGTTPNKHDQTSVPINLSNIENSTVSVIELSNREPPTTPPGPFAQKSKRNYYSSMTTTTPPSLGAVDMITPGELELGVNPPLKDRYVSQSPTTDGTLSFIVQQTTESSGLASTEYTQSSTFVSAIPASSSTDSAIQSVVSEQPALSTLSVSTTNVADTPQMTTPNIAIGKDGDTQKMFGGQAYIDIEPKTGSYIETTTEAILVGVSKTHAASVKESTTVQATKPTSPSDVLYDIVSESVISNVTLPNLLSVLISNRNDTWQFGNVERLFGQEIIGMSSSRQSHISLSETVLSSVSSFKSRNHSLDDRRQRSKERDHKDTTEKISEIITRIEATNRTKTFDQSMHRNITYHHYDNPLLTSDEETASVNVSASPATQSLNTSTSYTSLQNDSLITSVISLLSSIGSVQSFQNHNLAHEDNQKQPWNDLHMKTNKIEKNTHLPSVEGQSLVSSVEGQSLVSSVEGQSLVSSVEGQSLVSSVEGQSLVSSGEGKSLVSSVEGQSLVSSVEGQSLFSSVEGQSLVSFVDGQSLVSSVKGQPLASSVEGQPLASSVEGQPLISFVEGHSLVSSGELGSQGPAATESLQSRDFLKTTLSTDDPTLHNKHLETELGKSGDSHVSLSVNSLPVVNNVATRENASLSLVNISQGNGRLSNTNRTQANLSVKKLHADEIMKSRVTTASPSTTVVSYLMSQSTHMSQEMSFSAQPKSTQMPSTMTPLNYLENVQGNTIHDANFRVPARSEQNRPTTNNLDISLPMMVYTQNLPRIGTAPNPNIESLSPKISNNVQNVDKVQTGQVGNDISQNVNVNPTAPRDQETLALNTAMDHQSVSMDGQKTAQLTITNNIVPKETVVSTSVTDQVVNRMDHNAQVLNRDSSGTFWTGVSNNAGIQDGNQYLNKPTV